MEVWIIYTILYALINGVFQCTKKKSVEKNSIYEVLATFSLIAFLLVAFTSKNVFDIEINSIFIIFIKSAVIVVSWLSALYALDRMSLSLYSIINLSKIIFSILLSYIILGEQLTKTIIVGSIIVIIGLLLVGKISNTNDEKGTDLKTILILLISCLFSSISAIIDKEILKTISSDQLQFWFLLFLSILYWLIIVIRKQKIDFKNIKSNYWILITAIALVVGDRLLFIANSDPNSKVSVMTLIKQLSVIETILFGKIIFKEKNITKKLLCSILIIFGIVITTI